MAREVTSQVKDAVARLKAAGFERREFSVRAERKTRRYQGRRYTEFGAALISIRRCSDGFNAEVIRRLLDQGFYVTLYVGGESGVPQPLVMDSYERRGELHLWDLSTDQGSRFTGAAATRALAEVYSPETRRRIEAYRVEQAARAEEAYRRIYDRVMGEPQGEERAKAQVAREVDELLGGPYQRTGQVAACADCGGDVSADDRQCPSCGLRFTHLYPRGSKTPAGEVRALEGA